MLVYDLVDPNDPQGRTWREINLAAQHSIPIGTLVEVRWDTWYGNGACCKFHGRMWVTQHVRDCDGTPLYWISPWKSPEFAFRAGPRYGPFSEDRLTMIEVTEEIEEGYDVLVWEDSDEC